MKSSATGRTRKPSIRPYLSVKPQGMVARRGSDMLLVRPVMPAAARQKVAERVATSLRRAIVEGRFGPGDAPPPERDLADRYDVNRSSIREAMKRLEAWGLVRIRHGGATRVSDFFLSAGLEIVPYLVEVGAKVEPG